MMTKTITQDKEDVQNSVWCDHVAGLAWRMSRTKAIHPPEDTKYFGPICYKIFWTIICKIARHKNNKFATALFSVIFVNFHSDLSLHRIDVAMQWCHSDLFKHISAECVTKFMRNV